MSPHSARAALVAAVTLFGPSVGRADTYLGEPIDTGGAPARSESVWFDPQVGSGIGVGVNIGAGITGFVDPAVPANVGTMWALRAAFGTHVPLALEVGYMGSATPIDTEFGRADATMVGTTLEAALRYTLMPRARWSPYGFAGIGWQRYTINDDAFQLSDTGIANRDELLVLPVGAGIAFRTGALVTDVRGTFRAARGEDLVLENPELSLATGAVSFAPMHTWDASLNVGYEF